MLEKSFHTEKGVIHYWISFISADRPWLVFLPGLSADHRLFEKQIEAFQGEYKLFVWDAPGHSASRPFVLSFSLADQGEWLYQIMLHEGIEKPVIIGQSMGGYVAQALMEQHPQSLEGFIAIDSASLKRQYMKKWEIWALKHTKFMFQLYPLELLKKIIAKGCAETQYSYQLMYAMMDSYTKKELCELYSHGFKIIAEAVELDLAYEITCPALLICGEEDKAGYTKRYNIAWAKESGLPIQWIPGAGHNANTDKPEQINRVIRDFLKALETREGMK